MKCKITFFSQREKKKRICKESDQRLDTISVKGLKIFIKCSSERKGGKWGEESRVKMKKAWRDGNWESVEK